MHTQSVTLEYLPQYEAYCISDEKTEEIETNSRHAESMLPYASDSKLTIYARTEDNIPESWGNAEKNIMCIQWHPEDFAANGDISMQRIYNWLAQKVLHIWLIPRSF